MHNINSKIYITNFIIYILNISNKSIKPFTAIVSILKHHIVAVINALCISTHSYNTLLSINSLKTSFVHSSNNFTFKVSFLRFSTFKINSIFITAIYRYTTTQFDNTIRLYLHISTTFTIAGKQSRSPAVLISRNCNSRSTKLCTIKRASCFNCNTSCSCITINLKHTST